MTKIHISQGEFATGRDAADIISTILGSCVSICFHDPVARVGGMNHMLLADVAVAQGADGLGAAEIERLINQLRRMGAEPKKMRAKIFGGASMLEGMTDIGERNARTAAAWLEREGFEIEGRSVGGVQARQVQFWPATGVARQRLIAERPRETVVKAAPLNDVEMF